MSAIDIAFGTQLAGGCRAFYMRYLVRFPDDPTFSQLSLALNAGDVPIAFQHAHTLKGLCAELGILALSDACAALCDVLRPLPEQVPPYAFALLHDAEVIYRQTLEEIAAL